MKTIVLATKNQGKLKELQKATEDMAVKILSLSDFPDCPDCPETGDTFAENACQKALFYENYTSLPCLADDSGLEVAALEDAPGVFSARYAGENATDGQNNEKLVEELKNVPYEERDGKYRCVLAYAEQGKVAATFEGICDGKILLTPHGEGGFGYDPYFYIENLEKTVAEITIEEKQKISHRGKAFELWKKWFMEQKS